MLSPSGKPLPSQAIFWPSLRLQIATGLRCLSILQLSHMFTQNKEGPANDVLFAISSIFKKKQYLCR